MLAECTLCPRKCKVNRLKNEKGTCKTGRNAMVSSYAPHFGEESPLVGFRGSGTIFFTHCNLLCNFCQNYDISHEGRGEEISTEGLAGYMIQLQDIGCHNINFVTPSHVVPQILAALEVAIERGLQVPIIYNTGGYDSIATLKLLEGIVDIYMPDFKFWDNDIAHKTCNAADYPEVARLAVKEMYNQVGDLQINSFGIAERGLLIRHLVKYISKEISPHTYLNIMPQYRPCGDAYSIEGLGRAITKEEYTEALEIAQKEGIHRLDDRA